MKLKINPKRLVIFIVAVAPTTMLILGLIFLPGSSSPGKVRSQAVYQTTTTHCRNVGSGCSIGMKPRLHAVLPIRDLMMSAIAIADRL
jgi:hypothetical protein